MFVSSTYIFLTEFKENRAYSFLNKVHDRGPESEISSFDTNLSENERNKNVNRSPYRTRFRNKWGNTQYQNKPGYAGRRQKRSQRDPGMVADPSSSVLQPPNNALFFREGGVGIINKGLITPPRTGGQILNLSERTLTWAEEKVYKGPLQRTFLCSHHPL